MKQHAMGHWVAVLFSVVAMSVILLACAAELPERDTEAAQLYARYCAGSGCHTPIPPKAMTARLWDMQYSRMIELMHRSGSPLPSPEAERLILDYLHRHAEGSQS
jgi:hypothetical protein